jgi:hypothetical protein
VLSPLRRPSRGPDARERAIRRMETEISFGLCEIVIIEHRRRDQVPIFVDFFVDVAVADAMGPEKIFEIDVFVGWNGRIFHVGNGRK